MKKLVNLFIVSVLMTMNLAHAQKAQKKPMSAKAKYEVMMKAKEEQKYMKLIVKEIMAQERAKQETLKPKTVNKMAVAAGISAALTIASALTTKYSQYGSWAEYLSFLGIFVGAATTTAFSGFALRETANDSKASAQIDNSGRSSGKHPERSVATDKVKKTTANNQ